MASLANTALMMVQITAGWAAGSHAILADGVHTFADLAIDAILFMSLQGNAASARGSGRPEAAAMTSFLISAILMFTGIELLWQSVSGATGNPAPSANVRICMLLVAVMAIVVKEWVARYLTQSALRAGTVRGGVLAAAAWHARADAVSACVAAVGALSALAGFPGVDRLAAALIGCLLLGMGLRQAGAPIKGAFRRAWTWPASTRPVE